MRQSRLKTLLAAPILWVCATASAPPSPSYRDAVALWDKQHFPEAYNAFYAIAQREQFGRSPSSVYYLLTAGCRSGNTRTAKWSALVLSDYASDPRVQSAGAWGEVYARELQACTSGRAPGPLPRAVVNAQGVELVPSLPVNKLTMYFKRSGAGIKPGELPAANGAILPFSGTLPEDILALDKKGDRQTLARLLGERFRSELAGPDCVLVGAAPDQSFGDTPRHVSAFLGQMDRDLGLASPDRFLFVIVYPDASAGGEGDVPSFPGGQFSLGFSDSRVLTSYVLANPQQHGTIFHELVHQLVAANIGELSPEWLNEGLASLYEQTALVNGRYVAQPNWRGVFLRSPAALPTLEQVITTAAYLDGKLLGEFQGDAGVEQRHIDEAARIGAAERYLMLYLQQRQLLPQVVRYYRNLGPGPDSDWPLSKRDTQLRAFKAASGIDPVTGNADFQAWVARTVAAQAPSTFQIPIGLAPPAKRSRPMRRHYSAHLA